jgi:hypothetical protein
MQLSLRINQRFLVIAIVVIALMVYWLLWPWPLGVDAGILAHFAAAVGGELFGWRRALKLS